MMLFSEFSSHWIAPAGPLPRIYAWLGKITKYNIGLTWFTTSLMSYFASWSIELHMNRRTVIRSFSMHSGEQKTKNNAGYSNSGHHNRPKHTGTSARVERDTNDELHSSSVNFTLERLGMVRKLSTKPTGTFEGTRCGYRMRSRPIGRIL